jgi:hypothetical protein
VREVLLVPVVLLVDLLLVQVALVNPIILAEEEEEALHLLLNFQVRPVKLEMVYRQQDQKAVTVDFLVVEEEVLLILVMDYRAPAAMVLSV